MLQAKRIGEFAVLLGLCGLGATGCCKPRGGGLSGSSGEPQIQAGTGISSSAPANAAVAFGNVPIGQQRTLTAELANTGIATLTVTSVEQTVADPEFTVDIAEGVQVGAEPLAIPVHFVPFTVGAKAAVFVLHTDSTDVPTVTLALSGTGVKLSLSVVPEALDFGEVVIHTQAQLGIALANDSTVPLTLTVSSVQGADAALFGLGPLPTATLAAGATVSLGVTFAPVQVSSSPATAFFTIGYCDGCTPTLVNLRGEPVDTGLSITPNPLDFGFTPPNASATKVVKLVNVANRPIQMTSSPLVDTGHPAAAFALGAAAPAFPLKLGPGEEVDVPVVFTPPALDQFKGSVTFTSDDPQGRQVTVDLVGLGGGGAIQCLPASLAFGQVAVGMGVTDRLLCTNVGLDVPGHPEGNLKLTGLAVPDDAAFAVRFATPFPPAGLKAGESATIDVVYTPSAAKADLGHLHIASNDSGAPDFVVPLSGSGLALQPCDFAVVPVGGLAFGHVDRGASAQLQFELVNQGTNDCLVDALALTPSSDPAFSLPAGPIASQVVSYAGNSKGAPSKLPVTVEFSPSVFGRFAGDVAFTVSDPSNPKQAVHVTGTSEAGCLLIAPNDLDFGVVGVTAATPPAWCSSAKRNFQAYNTCNYDVHLTKLTMNPGIDGAEFVLSGQPAAYPVDVPPGSTPVSFQVAFHPDAQGVQLGSMGISTQELPTDPYLVTFHGDAEPNDLQTDTFTQSAQPKVDILWVIDNDDNQEVQALVAQNLPKFMDYALSAGIDFHMAVTSDDVCQTSSSDDGWFEPCAHCSIETSPNATIVTPETQDPTGTLGTLIQLGQSGGCDDPLFEPAYEALQPQLLVGHNQGFLRSDAYLAVIGVSDGDDNSPQSVQFYYNFFESVKGFRNASMFSFSAVNQLPTDPSGGCANGLAYDDSTVSRVPQLVQLTGGINVDICTSDWGTSLQQLGNVAFGARTSFPLTAQPEDPTKLTVELNGQALGETGPNNAPEWHYDSTANAIVFDPLAAPQPGDTVTVLYTVACG